MNFIPHTFSSSSDRLCLAYILRQYFVNLSLFRYMGTAQWPWHWHLPARVYDVYHLVVDDGTVCFQFWLEWAQ